MINYSIMKNIFTPLLALVLSFQAHAAIQTFKFVDDKGKEPCKQENNDQHCQLVSCDDNSLILNNCVTLAVGDVLRIQLPFNHSYFSYLYPYQYSFTEESQDSNVKPLSFQNHGSSYIWSVCKIDFLAAVPGVEEINIRFTEQTDYFNSGYYPTPLLGSITVNVVE